MPTKLIKLDDGVLVEVDVDPSEDQVQQISSGAIEKVDAKLDEIRDIMLKACRPITHVWRELNQEIEMEQAEVELGLSFEGEGNLYIAKSKMGANLKVKLIMKPKG